MRALVYARVSHDDSGRQRSVDEQVAASLAWVERAGWELVEVIREVGSASRFSTRKHRSGWANALTWIESGKIDILITWEHSRAARDLATYAQFRDLCLANNVVWGYGGKIQDFGERDARLISAFEAVLAEDEAHRTSERVRRAVTANANAGRPHGKHVFGYRRTYDPTTRALLRVEPDAIRAPLVREAARRVLDGEALYSIAKSFNERGIPTRRPKTKEWRQREGWTGVAIKQMLTMPAYAGLRQHRGEIIGNADWPALIEVDDWHSIQALLNDPARRRAAPWQVSKLLTGIAWCGASSCSAKLVAGRNSSTTGNKGNREVSYYANYHCPGFHTSIMMRYLDAIVTEHVLERLSRPDALALVGTSDDEHDAERKAILEEIAAHRAWLEAVGARAATERNLDLLFDQERRVKPLIAAANHRLHAISRVDPRAIALTTASDVRQQWAGLDISARRDIITSLLTVQVQPAVKRGARGVNQALERTVIRWRVG